MTSAPKENPDPAAGKATAPDKPAAAPATKDNPASAPAAQDKPTAKPEPQKPKPVPAAEGPAPKPANPPEKPAAKPQPPQNQNKPGQGQAKPGPGPGKPGPGPGPNKGRPPPAQVVEVQPLAQPATMRRRHWRLALSFLLIFIAPLAALIFYLWFIAVDQYASTTGFTVRQEEGASATDLLGGLAQFTGGSTSSDSDILYEFIQSQEMVELVNGQLDLRAHYSAHWNQDKLFSLWPDATLEDLVWYWQRVVQISYDQGTGLIEVRVLAFDPDYAQDVSDAIVGESQQMINRLNKQARDDAMRYALVELNDAVDRLKAAREAMTQFRTRTQIVDPVADIQSRLGVMANLQQQLATALIEADLLRDTTSPSDPRVSNAQRMIDVIRKRISVERQTFTSDSTETGAVGEDYPSLIAEFESLSVDRQFAEESYRAALTARDAARANASRQSRYLATFIPPTLSQTSEYPQREVLVALAALFLLMVWAIAMLIYYSLRDRS